ncbi:MAG TPA: hypothetical protein DCM08_12185 [Microscillaceae bacterium]|jgi:hypothetical protein|nr:hypothetical protein [Microscillaceae bacterium]
MDEYTQICNKLAELLAYQNQIREMSEEIAQITVTPPEIDEDNDTISWEEAVKHSESKKQHFE